MSKIYLNNYFSEIEVIGDIKKENNVAFECQGCDYIFRKLTCCDNKLNKNSLIFCDGNEDKHYCKSCGKSVIRKRYILELEFEKKDLIISNDKVKKEFEKINNKLKDIEKELKKLKKELI